MIGRGKLNLDECNIPEIIDYCQHSNNRISFVFKGKNKKNETVGVELTRVFFDGSKNNLAVVWYKHGYAKKLLPLSNYVCVDVYVTDENGCRSDYNPTHKYVKYKDENGKDCVRVKLNFDYVLSDSKENKERLINTIYDLAFNRNEKIKI